MKPHPAYARWGLLAFTTAMAGALVATGVWVARGAHDAAFTVAHGQGVSVGFSARRTLRAAGQVSRHVLQELLEGLAPQGVHYIEVLGPDSTDVMAVGWPSGKLYRPSRSLSPVLSAEISSDGASARITALLAEPGAPTTWAPAGPGEHPLPEKKIVLEVDSATAASLVRRGRVTEIISLLCGLLLVALSVISARVSLGAEKAALQLEHDRHLKSLGQMSAVLGHELRNPLTSLKGHVQLLLERLPMEHPGHKGAEVVLRETIRIEELSRQVLEFARTGTVERAIVNPAAVVGAAVDAAGGGRVRLDVASAPAAWSMDAVRIEEVVVNLLRNARDAAPEEKPIQVKVTEKGDRTLLIEVRDFGPGILPGEEERVFEPFYTRRVKGTGLGLALARRIVEGHGGTITAHNHSEGGAVFAVTIPLSARGESRGTRTDCR